MDYVQATLAAIQSAAGIREVARRQDLLLASSVLPSVHFFAGDELVPENGEDNRGYTMQFLLFVKITSADYRDLAAKLEVIEAAVQTAIETDPAFGGLCNWVRYQGNEEFLQKQGEPSGGKMLRYLIEYRRVKASPTTGY